MSIRRFQNSQPILAVAIRKRLCLLASAGLLVLIVALLPSIAFSQSQSINGTIRGQVTDISGAPVQGASITAMNVDTGLTRVVRTDSSGLYVIHTVELVVDPID